MKFTRRDTLILAATAGLATSLGLGTAIAQAQFDPAVLANVAIPDKPLGSETAPVTLIEYASPTCPHCAAFHAQVYPAFKTEYVDTGKVRFVLRPFIRNAHDAAIFILAEIAGPEQYHSVIETYMRTQAEWAPDPDPVEALFKIASQIGFTREAFEAALKDTELFAKLDTMRKQAVEEFGLTGTPTFYLNGKTLGGGQSFDTLKAEIDPLIPAGFVPADPAAPVDAMAPAADPAPAQ